MRKYIREIGNIQINIFLENTFFEKNEKIFDALLQSYTLCEETKPSSNKEVDFYVYEKEYYQYSINNNWVFMLMKRLELFYSKVLQCTIIHGSCIRLNGKNILLVGERLSGKTTLTRYLTLEKNGDYLDDDCVYLYENRYIGFGMPMPARDLPVMSYGKHYIAQTTDTDGIVRKLYSANSYLNNVNRIDVVVFPKYGVDNEPRLVKLTQAEAFEKILKNVRKYFDMKTMYVDIKELSKNAACYCIDYSSSEMAYDIISENIL